MQVKQEKSNLESNKKKPKTKRGKVTHFSKKSRKALLNKILQLEHRPGYYFVTLTYQNYETTFQTWKKDLNHFYSSVHYHYPRMGFLWKLEYQKRGAPHFHLLLFDPSIPNLKQLRSIVKEAWYKVVGEKSKSFRHHGTDVQSIKNIKTSGFYLAMYQCKDQNERLDIPSGRTWGIKGRAKMPFTEFGEKIMNEFIYIKFKRCVRKWVQKQKHSKGYATYLKNRFGSFNVFMPFQEQARLIEQIEKPLKVDALSLPLNQRLSLPSGNIAK